MPLVSRYQLFGEPRAVHIPHKEVDEHFTGGLGSPAPPWQRVDPGP
ncbi:hypothetical protein LAUMK13_04687 [Mycobacterium innocens]|uniref:Uncharacterized protein n=1 Tax=Mycobacterium innocens TaxID=2341083 RepID=A0A498QGX4_9MYCO|nr:hypothetical protein LAUMK13_04687 [Mycobacterium innocens]